MSIKIIVAMQIKTQISNISFKGSSQGPGPYETNNEQGGR